MSDFPRTMAARPLRRTGCPYSSSTLRAAAGFPEWRRARPAGSTAKSALEWAVIRASTAAVTPELEDRRIPTCSASVENGIQKPDIEIGKTISQ